jgi:hypothetical protein
MCNFKTKLHARRLFFCKRVYLESMGKINSNYCINHVILPFTFAPADCLGCMQDCFPSLKYSSMSISNFRERILQLFRIMKCSPMNLIGCHASLKPLLRVVRSSNYGYKYLISCCHLDSAFGRFSNSLEQIAKGRSTAALSFCSCYSSCASLENEGLVMWGLAVDMVLKPTTKGSEMDLKIKTWAHAGGSGDNLYNITPSAF